MFGLQKLFSVRVVQINQRPTREFGQVEDKPEGNNRKWNGDVSQNAPVSDQGQITGSIFEVRLDQPEHIDEARTDHEDAQPDLPPLRTLEIARQKNAERNHPVTDHVQGADRPPTATNAVQVPRNLVRNVAGIDDEEFREREIDVQHHESKRQLAEIVLLGDAEHRLHRLIARKQDQRQDAKREYRVTLSHEELQPIDGGVPRNVQRLDEDDYKVRHQNHIQQERWSRKILKPRPPAVEAQERARSRILVAIDRPIVQDRANDCHEAQHQDRLHPCAHRRKHEVLQVDAKFLFLGKNALLKPLPGLGWRRENGPLIEVLHQKEHRKHHYDDDPDGTGHRLQWPAKDVSPLAAGEILHEQERQCSSREVEARHHTHQVRPQQVRPATRDEEEYQRDHSEHHSCDRSLGPPA